MNEEYDNYPANIRNYDSDPASPFYEEPIDQGIKDDEAYDDYKDSLLDLD